MNDLRQVEVAPSFTSNRGEGPQERIGFFHCWSHFNDGDTAGTYALVEFENGKVERIAVERMRFLTQAELTQRAVEQLTAQYEPRD